MAGSNASKPKMLRSALRSNAGFNLSDGRHRIGGLHQRDRGGVVG